MSTWTDARTIPAAELQQHIGQVFHSSWLVVDQARIDAFATVTEDEQFIHVDPEKAAATRERKERFTTLGGIPLKTVYTQEDIASPIGRDKPIIDTDLTFKYFRSANKSSTSE